MYFGDPGLDFGGLEGPFWAPWGSLGVHFGGFGTLLGTWGPFESTRLSSDRPERLILAPFWSHFGTILELEIGSKFKCFSD